MASRNVGLTINSPWATSGVSIVWSNFGLAMSDSSSRRFSLGGVEGEEVVLPGASRPWRRWRSAHLPVGVSWQKMSIAIATEVIRMNGTMKDTISDSVSVQFLGTWHPSI